jgi:hypothetical protein
MQNSVEPGKQLHVAMRVVPRFLSRLMTIERAARVEQRESRTARDRASSWHRSADLPRVVQFEVQAAVAEADEPYLRRRQFLDR